mgnify:CR=1 FL=1|tara:strand:- start:139 stop:360 length:222 start_codon:yes stop_codon:yes gene_type:complete
MSKEEIGYSGNHLDDKEFRIKVSTGADIKNANNQAVVGEMFLETGISPSFYIAAATSTEDDSSIYKIGNITAI